MSTRANELIATLQLQPHPEGGWFRENFRSDTQVQPQDARPQRSALTSIYFLLQTNQHSHWHRVLSDEVWVHLEGDALNLWSWDARDQTAICTTLGPVDASTGQRPQRTISAGLWQAAWPVMPSRHGYTLLACMVGPGFDFSDFSMLQNSSDEAEQMRLAGLPGVGLTNL
jgi:predicted cupin superfamily sugar epimerase